MGAIHMIDLDSSTEVRYPAQPKPTATGSCHDCGAHGLEVFYRLSTLGYNVCPRCFDSRLEGYPGKATVRDLPPGEMSTV